MVWSAARILEGLLWLQFAGWRGWRGWQEGAQLAGENEKGVSWGSGGGIGEKSREWGDGNGQGWKDGGTDAGGAEGRRAEEPPGLRLREEEGAGVSGLGATEEGRSWWLVLELWSRRGLWATHKEDVQEAARGVGKKPQRMVWARERNFGPLEHRLWLQSMPSMRVEPGDTHRQGVAPTK